MDYRVRDAKLKELGFSSYQEYLASERWNCKRLEFLRQIQPPEVCSRCRVLSWVCELAYGHSVHVHHVNYEHLGSEEFSDLEILCRRCHEVEHFGKSDLPRIVLQVCQYCSHPKVSFDPPIDVGQLATETRGEIEHISGVIGRALWPKESVFRGVRRTAKLLEVMEHPDCFVPIAKGANA